MGGTFNTGAKPLADIHLRGFDTLGTWDITGCQLTKGSTEKPFSSDRTEYPCPDSSSVAKYGFCIFHASAGYSLNYVAAADPCRANGMRLCTLAEIGAAQANGAEWCSWGWVADRSNDTTGYRAFPMQQVGGAGQCCDKIGVCVISTAMTGGGGANCCR